jgi:hypothetical protein
MEMKMLYRLRLNSKSTKTPLNRTRRDIILKWAASSHCAECACSKAKLITLSSLLANAQGLPSSYTSNAYRNGSIKLLILIR